MAIGVLDTCSSHGLDGEGADFLDRAVAYAAGMRAVCGLGSGGAIVDRRDVASVLRCTDDDEGLSEPSRNGRTDRRDTHLSEVVPRRGEMER